MAEGRAAGCYTIGLAASGNGMGMSREDLMAFPHDAREQRLGAVAESMLMAGADLVIDSIADLLPVLSGQAEPRAAKA